MKKYSLEELTDKYIGKSGSIQRERFDFELRADVIGEIIKMLVLNKILHKNNLESSLEFKKLKYQKLRTMQKMFGFRRYYGFLKHSRQK